MSGILCDEGAKVLADLEFLGSSADRGSSYQLLLFTNNSVLSTLKGLALTAITEPTGTGYARKTLVNASWTRSGGLSSYALQTFTAGAGGWTGQVYGYAIASTGTVPRLMYIEIDPAGPYTMNAGDPYNVTCNILKA